MKKLIKLLFTFLMTISFASCNKNSDEVMLKSSINNVDVVNVDAFQLKGMIENEESFVLVTLLPTCSSCLTFKQDVLKPYILETHALIYAIDYSELEASENFKNKPYIKESPALFVYKNGVIKKTLKISKNEKEFEDLQTFKQFMEKNVVVSSLVEVDENYLDNAILNKESFVLYIGWNKCGDCKKLESEVLNKFLKEGKLSKNFYYLESDQYRAKKPVEEPILPESPSIDELEKYNEDLKNWNNWLQFAKKYQFDTFRNGRIPTLQFYQDGILNDMLVYNNDLYSNGVVIDSYFDEFDNKTISKEKLLKQHNNKVEEFLNKYLKEK